MGSEITQGRVDLARLVERVRDAFPDLAFADAMLNDLGEDHAVVVLDDRWVFRFPRTCAAAARGAAERRLLAALQGISPVATPCYELASPAGDFAGYRMIAGRELTEATFAALPRKAQVRILAEIGGFLHALHALPPELVSRDAADRPAEDAAWFAERYAERRSSLAAVLGPTLLDAADRFYQALPAAVATPLARVIHRDFSEDHILLDPAGRRLAGVIDFTDARLGDPAFDFAFLWAYGPTAPQQALQNYGASRDAKGILSRSLWWFTRYRIDQIWWSVSGARDYDVTRTRLALDRLFAALGL